MEMRWKISVDVYMGDEYMIFAARERCALLELFGEAVYRC